MDTLYIETTIVGHLAGKLVADPVVALRQQLTREWWLSHSPQYQVFISQLVLDECGAGDVVAAQERLEIIKDLALIDGTTETDLLASARRLLQRPMRSQCPNLAKPFTLQLPQRTV